MITGFVHQVQLSVLIKAVGMGYFFGVFFYVLTFLCCGMGKNTVSIFIRDILFFIAAAYLSFLFSLKYCSGMLRFYVAAGEMMGFLIFYVYPGKQIFHLFNKLSGKMNTEINKIRLLLSSAIAEKRKKTGNFILARKENKRGNIKKKSRKMHIADMTKKLLKHTKKTQKN